MRDKAPIDVSILVVSFNTKALTLAALESVKSETTDVSYEIIVVDNASHDGSANALEGHAAIDKLICLEDNIGFARANNLAAEYANGRYVLLLNSDTIVQDQAIDRLVAFADQNKEALIWGGRTIFPDGTLNPTSVWRHISLWSLLCRFFCLSLAFPKSDIFNRESYGDWQRDSERHVDIVTGCFFLMPTTVWTALGGFDPVFFMYGEEADLCRRASRIGANPLMTPTAQIVHYGGASETNHPDKTTRLFSALITLMERHWVYPLNLVGQSILLVLPLSRWIGFSLAGRLLGRESLRGKADIWKAVWDKRGLWRFGYAKEPVTAQEKEAQKPIGLEVFTLSK